MPSSASSSAYSSSSSSSSYASTNTPSEPLPQWYSSLTRYLTPDNILRLVFVLGFIYFLQYLQRRTAKTKRAASIQIHAARKFKERNEKRAAMHAEIVEKYKLPSEERQSFLLSLTATQLHQHMHVKHDVTSEEVVLLYSLRAMALGAITNCVTEEFYTEALKEAAAVDARIAARREGADLTQPGLLEGIPISIKDAFDQKGADATCGFAVRCNKPLDHDGLLIALLREAGAILYVRTNVPQALMTPESMCLAYGAVTNPWNLERTPGGSSGGEAALLAGRGSVLGVGSDIGGSLRIPAHFTGIYTIKPTPTRLTLDGFTIPCVEGILGQLMIRVVAGPMSHSVEDLCLLLKAWMSSPEMTKRDPYTPFVPLDESVISGTAVGAKKRLKIGYYETDGWFDPSPSCTRAVRQAVVALQELGHECVRWKPPNIEAGLRAYYGILSADSGEGILSGLEGEEMHEYYRELYSMMKIPKFLKNIIVKACRHPMIGQKRLALMLSAVHSKSSEELYQYQCLMVDFLRSFTSQWQDDELDCVIAPGLGLPALHHGDSRYLTLSCSYTFLYNVLHYPVGTVPIGLTEKYEEKYESTMPRDYFSKSVDRVCKGSEGLPVGVQVIGLPNQDEMVLRVMKDLEKKIQFKEIPELAEKLKIV